jgi:agmatinase
VGFDVVELCPIAGDVSSDFLAARLAYKFLGYIFKPHSPNL